MENAAVFIDLPNFYSRFIKSGIDNPKILRDYFLNWLDFDLVAKSLTGGFSGVWVFYSGERIGPSSERITGKTFNEYIKRINTLKGVTARDVNIPGEQREPLVYICKKCNYEGKAEAVSEKGVDSTLTVHLFDTMDSWNVAFLLSGDADFVPAVASLRRRGKTIIGGGFPDASTALVRECYDYVNLNETFLRQDILLYSIFKKDGIAQKCLVGEVKQAPDLTPGSETSLSVDWYANPIQEGYGFDNNPYSVHFEFKGSIDLMSRYQLLVDLKEKYGIQVSLNNQKGLIKCYISNINSYNIESMKRRLSLIVTSLNATRHEITNHSGYFRREYSFIDKTGKYQLDTPSTP